MNKEEAKAALESAGYLCELTEHVLYVRTNVNAMPDRLWIVDRGFVSAVKVKSLINKAK